MTRWQLQRWFTSPVGQQRQKAGKDVAAQSSLAVAGLARDCERSLPKILPWIESLRSAFARSSVILIESDSTDATKTLLENYCRSSDGAILDSRDTGITRAVPPFSRERIDRMAACRNRYLKLVAKLDPAPDFLLVLDLDLHKLPPEGVWDSFSCMDEWDVVTANGLALPGKGLKRALAPYKYWDTYALRTLDVVEKPQTAEEISENWDRFGRLQPGAPLVQVGSAFGGAAIYRWPMLIDLHYSGAANDDVTIASLCEHVVLHNQLRGERGARICINPAFLLFYETGWDVTVGRKVRQVKRWFRKRSSHG